jgi:formate dehydrogenase iron-sulfur subunit
MEVTGLPQSGDAPRSRLAALMDHLVGPFRQGVPPPSRPATGFYTDTTVCIGCKACEVACKQWNQLPSDGFNWTGNSYDNTAELSGTSWRHVKFVEQLRRGGEPGGRVSLEVVSSEPSQGRWLMMSDVCKHCVTAPCQ